MKRTSNKLLNSSLTRNIVKEYVVHNDKFYNDAFAFLCLHIDVFKQQSKRQQEQIIEAMEDVHYTTGQTIMEANQNIGYACLIVYGEVSLVSQVKTKNKFHKISLQTRSLNSRTGISEKTKPLGYLSPTARSPNICVKGPGQWIGLEGFLNSPSEFNSCQAIAISPVTVYKIHAGQFSDFPRRIRDELIRNAQQHKPWLLNRQRRNQKVIKVIEEIG